MLICGILDEISPLTRLKDEEAATLLSYFFCQAPIRASIMQPATSACLARAAKRKIHELEQRVQEETGGANEDQKGASRLTIQHNRDIFIGISRIFRDRD